MHVQTDRVAHIHRVKRVTYCKADLCVFSKPAASRHNIHVMLAAHTHTLAAHAPLLLPAFPKQLRGMLCSENFIVRSHQHLLSPQSWIWVFSCSVSQENRADLPSSSSYFRSLTKCCKNTDKLTVIYILSKNLYGWYRNQAILKLALSLSKLLTLPCTQHLSAEPSVFPSLPNYISQPSDGWITPTLRKRVISSECMCLIAEPEATKFTC